MPLPEEISFRHIGTCLISSLISRSIGDMADITKPATAPVAMSTTISTARERLIRCRVKKATAGSSPTAIKRARKTNTSVARIEYTAAPNARASRTPMVATKPTTKGLCLSKGCPKRRNVR